MISDKVKKITLVFFIVPILIPLIIIIFFNYINDEPLLAFKDIESPNWVIKGTTMGHINWNVTINHKSVDTADIKLRIDSLLLDFNAIASTYLPDSEISNLNQSSQDTTFALSEELCYLVDKSIEYCNLSDSYYDVTIMPLVNLWNFGYDDNSSLFQDSIKINETLKNVDCQKLILSKCNLNKNQNMEIDLSSIAKGYAVDIVSDYLTNFGFNNHIVDIGGEVRVSGLHNGEMWIVGITNPMMSDSLLASISMTNKSVASSGTYHNFFIRNGLKYSHIINPKTGYPIKANTIGSTVIADKCIDADALATIAMLIPPIECINLFESLNVEGLIMSINQTDSSLIYKTKGFDDYIKK